MDPETIQIVRPGSIEELAATVRESRSVALRGGGSKTALSCQGAGATCIEMTGLSGMLEYEPEEFTFTAYAGTRVAEIEPALAEHGQYLPFDPLLAGKGATLGGSVASGLSGPGRYRYGGVRDFVLGIRFVDGQGSLVRSGGKVVKNAAGFDLSKLMVGSLGSLGALVELSFKVFPRPAATMTLRFDYPGLEDALKGLVALTHKPFELYALDLEAGESGAALLVRLGGLPEAFARRSERVQGTLERAEDARLEGDEEAGYWRAARDLEWAPKDSTVVKVPLTPKQAVRLEAALAQSGAKRRYSGGANQAWVAWPGRLTELDELLNRLELAGLVVLGPGGQVRLGVRRGEAFARRIKAALDPEGKFSGSDDHAA